MKLIHTGSESKIFLDNNSIYKFRQIKSYRLPELDKQIREKRTKKEMKILKKLNDSGLNVPQISLIDESFCENFVKTIAETEYGDNTLKMSADKATIKMSYIQGKTLNNLLLEGKCSRAILSNLGQVIGKIHSLGIIHGDITPSNIIILNLEIYIIDFGLSFHSKRIEDRAVDIWMFEKILKSLYEHCEVENSKDLIQYFLAGYNQNSDKKDSFFNKLAGVRERGRKIGC